MNIPSLADPIFIAKIIDFIIFVSAIVWLFNTYGRPALISYQEAQNTLVADAETYRKKFEAAVEAANLAIEQAKADSIRMLDSGTVQAAKLIEDERNVALEHQKRILAHAGGELERERYRVRRELLEETVELAHARARELAKREIDPAKQQMLVERLIEDLERARA